MKQIRRISIGLGVSICLFGAAQAHHSFAMFDQTKEVSVAGTVKDFQWENPHTWIQLVGQDGKQSDVEFSIEGMSPNIWARQGWTHDSLKPGDKITLVMHPFKDGRPGGSFVRATKADGTVLGRPAAANPTLQ